MTSLSTPVAPHNSVPAFDIRPYIGKFTQKLNPDAPVAVIISSRQVFNQQTAFENYRFSLMALYITEVARYKLHVIVMDDADINRVLSRFKRHEIRLLILSAKSPGSVIKFGEEEFLSSDVVKLNLDAIDPKATVVLDTCYGSASIMQCKIDGGEVLRLPVISFAKAFKDRLELAQIEAYSGIHWGVVLTYDDSGIFHVKFVNAKSGEEAPAASALTSSGEASLSTEESDETTLTCEEDGKAGGGAGSASASGDATSDTKIGTSSRPATLSTPVDWAKAYVDYLSSVVKQINLFPNAYCRLLDLIIESRAPSPTNILHLIVISYFLRMTQRGNLRAFYIKITRLSSENILAKISAFAFGAPIHLEEDQKFTNYSTAILRCLKKDINLKSLLDLFFSYYKSENPEFREFYKEISPVLTALKTIVPK